MTDKWKRVNVLHHNIKELDSVLKRDILRGNTDALVVRLMRQTGIRVGGKESIRGRLAKDVTYGATTLKAKHAKITPSGKLILDFIGKKGIRHHHTIEDPVIVGAFRKLLSSRSSNDPIFDHVTSKSTMRYLRHALNLPYLKNHDLRTHIANDIAITEIKKLPLPKTEKEYRKLRNSVGEVVAQKLGNGRLHALNSYINPLVFSIWRRPGWNP